MTQSTYLKSVFKKHLDSQEFERAFELLEEDIYLTEDLMDERDEKSYKALESHWSAVETGEKISTPIDALYEIFQVASFKDQAKIIDLGSGHGHPAFVWGALNETLKIEGYDIVEEKVQTSNKTKERLQLENVSFFQKDLSSPDFSIPQADYYFFYNPFNEEVFQKVFADLKKLNTHVIISTGGRELKYLKQPYYEMVQLLEGTTISFFRSLF